MSLIHLLKTPSGRDSALRCISRLIVSCPVPLEFLPQSVSLCLHTHAARTQQRAPISSWASAAIPSSTPVTTACARSREQGNCLGRNYFSLRAHSNSAQTNLICCFWMQKLHGIQVYTFCKCMKNGVPGLGGEAGKAIWKHFIASHSYVVPAVTNRLPVSLIQEW